jgi:hypothetical protein
MGILDTISGWFSSDANPVKGGGTDWSSIIASAIPSLVSAGAGAYSESQKYRSPDQQFADYQQKAQYDQQMALAQLGQELALKKQYGLIGGGGGGGGGQSTQQMIDYYKQRDKYQGIGAAYQAAMSTNNSSTNAILQALNNLASSIKTTR